MSRPPTERKAGKKEGHKVEENYARNREQRRRNMRRARQRRRQKQKLLLIFGVFAVVVLISSLVLLLPFFHVKHKIIWEAGEEFPEISHFLRWDSDDAEIVSGADEVDLHKVGDYEVTVRLGKLQDEMYGFGEEYCGADGQCTGTVCLGRR